MKTFFIALSVCAVIIFWFKFAGWIGEKTNSVEIEIIIALGIPIALIMAICLN